MKTPCRVRRILKWFGLAACVVLSSAFVASAHWQALWINKNRTLGAGVANGGVLVGLIKKPGPYMAGPGWHPKSASGPYHWWFGGSSTKSGSRIVFVPLWAPTVLIALPTAIFFWLDRRRIPPGHCKKCGYNLTGNVSGVCPECGLVVSHQAEESKHGDWGP